MSFMYEIKLKDGSWHIYESPESDPEPSDEYWEFFDNHRDEVAGLFSVHLTGLPTDKEKKNSLAQNNGSDMNYKDAAEWMQEHFKPCGNETKMDEALMVAIRALKKYDEIVRIINAPIYIQEDVFRYKAICAVVGDEADSARPDYMPLIEKEGEKSNE